MNLNEHIYRMKTLMSLNENTLPVNLTPEYLKERIPFLKSFNDFSDKTRINMQKIVYNENVNMKLGDQIVEFKQFNTSSEFYYSIYEMDQEQYRITFSLQNRFWTMPPNYTQLEDQLQFKTLLLILQQMEKKLSYTYDEIKPEPTLSAEELNQVINNINKCFFEFEDYVMNQMNVDIKNPLDETTDISEDYPTNFKMEEFKKLTSFKARLAYCNQHLKRIGSGSSRAVYQIDEQKVLKLAMNRKGLAQNEQEVKLATDHDVQYMFTKIFDYDENYLWVEMELAKKLTKSDFERLTGFKFNYYTVLMNNYWHDINNKKNNIMIPLPTETVNKMWEEEFIYSMLNFMASYDLPVGDFLNETSYGLVNRNGHETIVLVDFGINNAILKKYYKK